MVCDCPEHDVCVDVAALSTVCLHTLDMLCCYTLFCSLLFSFLEGFSVGTQSSVTGYSQLSVSPVSQTHLRSGIGGRCDALNKFLQERISV